MKRNFHRTAYENSHETHLRQDQTPMTSNFNQGEMATQQGKVAEEGGKHLQPGMGQNGRKDGNQVAHNEHLRPNRGGKDTGYADEEGFRKQGRRRGPRHNNHKPNNGAIPRTSSTGDIQREGGQRTPRSKEEGEQGNRGRRTGELKINEAGILQVSAKIYHREGGGAEGYVGRMDGAGSSFIKPSYYQQLENGILSWMTLERIWNRKRKETSTSTKVKAASSHLMVSQSGTSWKYLIMFARSRKGDIQSPVLQNPNNVK